MAAPSFFTERDRPEEREDRNFIKDSSFLHPLDEFEKQRPGNIEVMTQTGKKKETPIFRHEKSADTAVLR